ncbi:MAG: hypothetical protein ACOCG5_02230 [Candidatus Alkaliphilus sp. MAG34]|nr:hypothetical protein [Clostridiales bacterium]
MRNILKIKLSKEEKERLQQYKKGLLDYLKVLDEFDVDRTHTKNEGAKNNTIRKSDDLCNDEDSFL